MEKFDIQKLSTKGAPKGRFSFTMFLEKSWYYLTAKQQIIKEDSVLGLDASILQDYVLEPILKIDDPRTDKRIDFVGVNVNLMSVSCDQISLSVTHFSNFFSKKQTL